MSESNGKEFLFLYPIVEYFNAESFIDYNARILNRCIDVRYRKKGFNINYAIFDDCEVSDIVELQPSDRIIKVGIDFSSHTQDMLYPSPDEILKQLNGGVKQLIIAGFHLWDCVTKLARKAYENGLNVMVDEDLTELFPIRLKDPNFINNLAGYPTFNPLKLNAGFLDAFKRARKNKPWMWQYY